MRTENSDDMVFWSVAQTRSQRDQQIHAMRFLLVLSYICFTVALSAGELSGQSSGQQIAAVQPNIVLINIDDADADLLRPEMLQSFYPNIRTMAQNGMRFTNLHATTPFCAPSRAALFRGQYAFNTGVKVNDTGGQGNNGFSGGYGEFVRRGYDRDELGVWLRNAGYRTMHIGKYHHHGFDSRVPPGWDDFRLTGGATYFGTYRFTNKDKPKGRWYQTGEHEYITNVDANDAVDLIIQQAFSSKPFFLYVAPIAPHTPGSAIPEDMVDTRYTNFAAGHSIENAPDLHEEDVSDKPKHLRFSTPENWRAFNRRLYISRVRAIKSVDDMVGRIVEAIDSIGATDNTYVFLTSDNGFQLGHHNIQNKTDPYHRTSNVPLLVVGPGVPANRSGSHLLAHIDICPTILELADAQIPATVDAKSFFPLLFDSDEFDEESWQNGIMLENWSKKNNFGRRVVGSYVAWRQHHEVFVSWANGQYEYYDLNSDPYQLENAYSRLPVSRKQALKRAVRRFRTTRIDPITTLENKFESFTQSKRVQLRGYAEDDAGVFGTLLTMKSFQTKRYWNGSSWQDQWYGHFLPVKNFNQPITTWDFKTQVELETSTGNDFLVFSYRSVGAGGELPANVSYHINRIDGKAPVASFSDNIDQPVFDGDVMLDGTRFDAVEFDKALLSIRRLSTDEYWNGNGFQSERTELETELTGENGWRFSHNLPPGKYRAGIRGVDAAGNKQQPANSLRFTVK